MRERARVSDKATLTRAFMLHAFVFGERCTCSSFLSMGYGRKESDRGQEACGGIRNEVVRNDEL